MKLRTAEIMWWNLLLGLQTHSETTSHINLGEAIASLMFFLATFYGLYLWTMWLRAISQKDFSHTPVCFRPEKPEQKKIPVPAPPVLLAGFWIAINLCVALYPQTAKEASETHPADIANMLIIQVVVGVFLLVLWEFSGKKYHLADYFTPQNWKADLQAGGEIFLLSLPLTFLLGAASLLWRTPEEQHPLLLMLQSRQEWNVLALIILTAVVMAPLFEELLFRVLLLNGLQDQGGLSLRPAVLIVSVIFCLVHGWHDALQLMPLSLCLGWSLARRRSYLTVVIGHALFNGFMLTMALLNVALSQ